MEKSLKVLKALRKQRKMMQAELAPKMNVASNTISTWEQGNREPSYSD
ncbi:MAG: helix-turn-helix transcriptional regulator [Selenomonadaceae bacterium]|nr:helix-turn-helix transcriptional regulator [Selenomonadaceae bacterium]